MDSNKEKLINELKDLSNLEFEILFIDDLCKKLKKCDRSEIRTNTLLLLNMSTADALKSYIQLAEEANRDIPHKDVIDLIINKCEDFLKTVASDENYAPYAHKNLTNVYEIVKELLFKLKDELVTMPKYAHLKPNLE